MKVVCTGCGKEFRLQKNTVEKYEQDSLCGKCRARASYLKNIDRHRKTGTCPICGKKILKTSKYCSRCSQLGERNHNYKHGNASSLRTCSECGNPITPGSNGLCKECYSKTLFGEGNPNYRWGHYVRDFYNTTAYKNWKISVFERDDWTCALCGMRKRTSANAHHILPKRDYPGLVYLIDNGITLCPKCHISIFGSEYDYVEQFQQKIRPYRNSVNSVNAEMPTPSQA